MRGFLLLLLLHGTLLAADARYPLWNGRETVEQYASRVNLPATKTVELGLGQNLELVLIPAGEFMMGTYVLALDQIANARTQLRVAKALLVVGGGIVLVLLLLTLLPAARHRRRPNFSLARLLVITVAAGLVIIGYQHNTKYTQTLKQATSDYFREVEWYDIRDSEAPIHGVTITAPFYMGKVPVTQAQYLAVMQTNPSKYQSPDYPVDHISRNAAQEFCNSASKNAQEQLRLPSEAEWEYACRAGTFSHFYSGDEFTDLERVSNHLDETGYTPNSYIFRPAVVGKKEPNAFGLHDMHGSVWQWCSDWYSSDYYDLSSSIDPKGPDTGTVGVLRGGSYASPRASCRSAFRCWSWPDNPNFNFGLRVVINAPLKP